MSDINTLRKLKRRHERIVKGLDEAIDLYYEWDKTRNEYIKEKYYNKIKELIRAEEIIMEKPGIILKEK